VPTPTPTPADLPTHVRSLADLTWAWRCLMGELGFGGASIWVLLITADDEPFPHLVQIEQADTPPDRAQAAGFAEVLAHLLGLQDPGARAALLRSRPGGGDPSADDLAWAWALSAACAAAGVPLATTHLATDVDLRPIEADDLLAAGGPEPPGTAAG